MLLNLLPQKRIATKVEAKDWYEVTKQAGELLMKDDLIENIYIDAMIESIEDKGPYIVIAKGIAILHARPEDGVKDLGMSLLTLASPVEFGHECNDPVQIVFALGAVDRNKHLQALSELMKVLMKDNSVNEIANKNTSLEVFNYIRESINNNQ